MKTQIAFMFEGVKYFTFYGSNYMAATFPDTNVVALNDVTKSKAVQGELRKLNNGINWNMTPMLVNEQLSKVGRYIQGMGEVTVGGTVYHVEFSPNGMNWNAYPTPGATTNEEISKEVVPEVTTKPDTEEVTSTEKHDTVDAITSDMENTDTVVDTSTDNASVAIPTEKDVKFPSGKTNESSAHIEPLPMESGQTTLMKPAIDALPNNLRVHETDPVNPKAIKQYSEERWGNNKGNRAKLGLLIGNPHPSEGLVFHGNMPSPNTSEGFRNRRLRTTTVTGRPAGMSFGRQVLPNTNINNAVIVDSAANIRQASNVPVQTLDKDTDTERAEALMRSWQNTQKVDTSARWEQPVVETVAEETVDVKAVTDVDAEKRKAAKEAVRATLPPEINAVIGDIPVEMLTSIAEFTSSPIDEKLLDEQGDLFCIDRRWHKQGKWFCIDVVCNTSRYFFNSRLGVSIEIPISFCKAWYDVIM